VVAAVAAPTFALSSSVRGFFGLGHRPFLIRRAVPVLSLRAADGTIVRLSTAPIGRCSFVTFSRAAVRPPRYYVRAAVCRARFGDAKNPLRVDVSRSRGRTILDGHVSKRLAFRRVWFFGITNARHTRSSRTT
jgi:hypothetical protein